MKTNTTHSMQRLMPHSKESNRGFTLIITISLLVLLTLVAIGLLSLSSVTIRGSAQQAKASEARANARMALMMAIGELTVKQYFAALYAHTDVDAEPASGGR